MPRPLYVVSACLAGTPCRYNGTSHACPQVMALVAQGRAVPLCPEVLGGLTVPRLPCELHNGRVVDSRGGDHTQAFVQGAEAALQQALHCGATAAIVKSRSPSCGWGKVYDGTFNKRLVTGHGLWAARLLQAGLRLYSEESLPPDEDEPM